MLLQNRQNMQQQVPEITGINRAQPGLIGGIELLPLAIGIAFALARADILRGPALILPLVDQAAQLPRGPALLVNPFGLNQLLHQPQLIVGVEDGEIGLQPHQFGMTAQHLGRDGMEGAEPRHPLHCGTNHLADPLAHFARGLVGEGDGQDLRGIGAARGHQMRQPRGQCRGLARARARQHQHRPFGRQHGFALGRVQPPQIGRIMGRGQWKSHGGQLGTGGGRGKA